MTIHQPQGQILLFSPSFSGKSFLTNEFKMMGLTAFDLEKEGPYVRWCNDRDGKPVKRIPKKKTKAWLTTHHFLLDRQLTKEFLAQHKDCLVFVHSWDILEHLDLFTRSFFLYINPQELERRMLIQREDHIIPSDDQINFMRQRHQDRYEDAVRMGIPIIDASGSAQNVYVQLI